MTQKARESRPANIGNIFHRALVNIIFTYHHTSQQVRDQLIAFDITPQQYNVLKILKSQYPSPSTINFIRSKIIDQMTDTSRIVDRLISKDYLEKKMNLYDKRAVDIILTDKGLSLVKKIEKEVDFASILSPNLSEQEAIELSYLLEKIRP